METFGSRLRDAMIARSVGVSVVARRCKVSRQTVAYWLKMKDAELSGVNLLLVSEIVNVRPRWLALGIAPMLTIAPDAERQARLSAATN